MKPLLSGPATPPEAFSPVNTPIVRKGASEAEIDKAAKKFEAEFLSQMLQPMFAGIETGGPFGGGHGEETFKPMLLREYAKAIANSGGIGLADDIRAVLLRAQEGNTE